MGETTRRSFLGGVFSLLMAPSIVTAAAVRPGLWTPPRKLYVPHGHAWAGQIDGFGKLVRWKPLGALNWLPMDTHTEHEHWKRMRFPSGYWNTEQQLSPPRLVHKWAYSEGRIPVMSQGLRWVEGDWSSDE
jgi:hypothetical protein